MTLSLHRGHTEKLTPVFSAGTLEEGRWVDHCSEGSGSCRRQAL